ncbi:isocitrate lyase/phosphoenolpyruvate mutase family protein [Streptomyces sp. NPDC057062]|uniref:isocitrate lyase/phosphoenolpyruvate mutase family protein n=1 Tax=Streptomyces sp. NPDC057062 TaxID=3346011 RepID=UPI00363B1E1B
MGSSQQDKPQLFRSLRRPPRPFALANACDAASARVIEAAGAGTLATTGASIAKALGSPGGDTLTRDHALKLISRTCRRRQRSRHRMTSKAAADEPTSA